MSMVAIVANNYAIVQECNESSERFLKPAFHFEEVREPFLAAATREQFI